MSAEATELDLRREPRTNMLVMATLYAGTSSAPVKVRNMTPAGALIEGAIIPPPGTAVTLRRGSLAIAAEVMWCSEARAGLKFVANASVAAWLPRGRALSAQQRVDEVVEQVKASTAIPADSPPSNDSRDRSVTALELTRVRKLLETLGEDLANDDDVVVRHGAKLQSLDLAAQLLAKLASERP